VIDHASDEGESEKLKVVAGRAGRKPYLTDQHYKAIADSWRRKENWTDR
jgi:hypothetical protein